jgi:hypothetical protein
MLTGIFLCRLHEMEYRELMTAGDKKEQTENIYHLSVALLRMWRLLNHSK